MAMMMIVVVIKIKKWRKCKWTFNKNQNFWVFTKLDFNFELQFPHNLGKFDL